MRILQVMDSCAVGSGVASVVMRYYRHVSHEVEFDFLLYREAEPSYKAEILSRGGRIFFTGKPTLRSLLSYIKGIDEFFRLHAKEYDAVQLHEVYMNAIVLRLAKKHGIPVRIAHSHTTKLSESRLGAVRNAILYKPVRRYANVFFACSADAGVAAFGKRIQRDARFHIINNAIEVAAYAYSPADRARVRAEQGLPQDAPVLGHVGRLSPQKNHTLILSVFARLCQKRPGARLVLVGKGPLEDRLRAQCVALGIEESVLFLGLCEDIGPLLSAMDVFFFPSVFEGLGLALVEAQANGLPCVASAVIPGEARVLPSYKALPLNAGEEAWVDALLASLGQRDENAPAQVAEAGFDLVREAEQLVALYQTLQKEHSL